METRSCVDKFYTDWDNLSSNNYWPEEVSAPEPVEGERPCPPETPYFNWDKCIECEMPDYFN